MRKKIVKKWLSIATVMVVLFCSFQEMLLLANELQQEIYAVESEMLETEEIHITDKIGNEDITKELEQKKVEQFRDKKTESLEELKEDLELLEKRHKKSKSPLCTVILTGVGEELPAEFFEHVESQTEVLSYDQMSVLFFEQENDAQKAVDFFAQIPEIVGEMDTIYSVSTSTTAKNKINETLDLAEWLKTSGPKNLLREYLEENSTAETVTVAVIDTGINPNIKEFEERVIEKSYNFSKDEGVSSMDYNGHGTAIAYTIALNSTEQVKILPIKVANKEGTSSALSLYMGIEAAILEEVDVINLSMNSVATVESFVVEQAIAKATNKGILVVVSSGNQNNQATYYSPSNVESAIVVGSVKEDKSLAEFSNRGETIDFVSNGTNLLVKDCNGNDQVVKGTSYSAALISAVMAGLKNTDKTLSRDEIYEKAISLAEDLGEPDWDEYYGHGYLGFQEIEIEMEHEVKKEHLSILDIKDWREIEDSLLRKYYVDSTVMEIATFVQVNSNNREEIILKIPDLDKEIVTSESEVEKGTKKFEYYSKLNLQEYETSAGLDIGKLSGYFWIYLTCTNYYKDENQKGMVRTDYKVNIRNHNSGEADRQYTVTLDSSYNMSGQPQTDYFALTLNQSVYQRRQGGSSFENSNQYSIYRVELSYLTKEYHTQSWAVDQYRNGYRINTYAYTILNQQNTNTLSTGLELNDRRRNFTIQINANNTGQGSYWDARSNKWVDDPNSINAICRIHQPTNVALANLRDYFTDTGELAGISKVEQQRTYPNTKIRGSEWGTASLYEGYHYSHDSSDDYYFPTKTHRNLLANRYFAPNTYRVVYQGNGATAGNTLASDHIYNQWGNLSPNGFTYSLKVKYQLGEDENLQQGVDSEYQLNRSFQSFSYNGQQYSSSQRVRNLSTSHQGVITMYASWGKATANTLTKEKVSKTGYELSGWQGSDGKWYAPGQKYEIDSPIVFTPIWKPNVYKIVLDHQGATDKGTQIVYVKYHTGYYIDIECQKKLTNNQIVVPEKIFSNVGIEEGKRPTRFIGYNKTITGNDDQVIDAMGIVASSISGEKEYSYFKEDTILYAKYEKLNALIYDPNLEEKDLHLIKNCYTVPKIEWKNKEEEVWTPYQEAQVTQAPFSNVYRFLGWSMTKEITDKNQLVQSFLSPDFLFQGDQDCTLYAQWDTSYNIAYLGNQQTSGLDYIDPNQTIWNAYLFSSNKLKEIEENEDTQVNYFSKSQQKPTTDSVTGEWTDEEGKTILEEVKYSFIGWRHYNGKDRLEDDTISPMIYHRNIGELEGTTLIANANKESNSFLNAGLTIGVPASEFSVYGILQKERELSISDLNGKEVHDYDQEETRLERMAIHMERENQRIPYVNLFAYWDSYPQIHCSDIYISLEEAWEKEVTEEFLLQQARATDEELIHEDNPLGIMSMGVDEAKQTQFFVLDYSKQEFEEAQGEGTISITFVAKDKVGNTTKKKARVILTDTSGKKEEELKLRFISKEYLFTLEEDSVWNLEDYAKILNKTLYMEKSNKQYTKPSPAQVALGAKIIEIPGSGEYVGQKGRYLFTKKQMKEAQQFVKENGLFQQLEKFYDRFMNVAK